MVNGLTMNQLPVGRGERRGEFHGGGAEMARDFRGGRAARAVRRRGQLSKCVRDAVGRCGQLSNCVHGAVEHALAPLSVGARYGQGPGHGLRKQRPYAQVLLLRC